MKVRDRAPRASAEFAGLDEAYAEVYRDHPFETSHGFVIRLMNQPTLRSMLALTAARCSVRPQDWPGCQTDSRANWAHCDVSYLLMVARGRRAFDVRTALRRKMDALDVADEG